MTNTQPTAGWREQLRDWWYSVQDDCRSMMHSLPEKRRVEVEHIVRDAIEQELATARKEWEEKLDRKIYDMARTGGVCAKDLNGPLCNKCARCRGYNRALDNVRALLTTNKENE